MDRTSRPTRSMTPTAADSGQVSWRCHREANGTTPSVWHPAPSVSAWSRTSSPCPVWQFVPGMFVRCRPMPAAETGWCYRSVRSGFV